MQEEQGKGEGQQAGTPGPVVPGDSASQAADHSESERLASPGDPADTSPDYIQQGHGQATYGPSPEGTSPVAGYPPFGHPAYDQGGYDQGGYGQGGYGQGGYGQGGYGQGGYSQGQPPPSPSAWYDPPGSTQSLPFGYGPPGYAPPPYAGAKRRRNLLTYLAVAVLAAGAGAGVTGLLLNNPAPATSNASNQAPSGGENSGAPNGSVPNSGNSGAHISSAVERAVEKAVRPGLVDIASNLGYQGSEAAATGMVISSDGLVLTNNHVITGTTELHATLVTTHQTFAAKWLGYDARDDVAVIKLVGARNLPIVPLGNSTVVKVGDGVIALGNAEGQGGAKPATGTITALNQTIHASDNGAANSETLHGMLQTNAGIVQGDSGGPLVSTSGHVIGMTTAAATSGLGFSQQPNVGFAIPINKALQIAHAIINGQSSPTIQIGSTGFMGVLVPNAQASQSSNPAQQRRLQLQQDQATTGFPVQPATPVCLANDLNAGIPKNVAPARTGALIIGELCDTPANRAGIIAGDVITNVGGHAVASPSSLTTIMRGFRPGQTVVVTWIDISGHTHHSSLLLIQAPPR